MEQFSVAWTSVHSVHLCKRTEVNTFVFPSWIHFSACEINFTYRKSEGVLQISKMAGDQNVASMLVKMQVLIQHISEMENEFIAWFHVCTKSNKNDWKLQVPSSYEKGLEMLLYLEKLLKKTNLHHFSPEGILTRKHSCDFLCTKLLCTWKVEN